MIIHFVYVLSHNGVPLYIGISRNPTIRLFQHKRGGEGLKISRRLRSIKDISSISINILDSIKTKSIRTCKSCHELEKKWIMEYKSCGHKLFNDQHY